jgi:signal transduction histidine kinase
LNLFRLWGPTTAIGILAGGIVNDFNNILFPIIGFAELLEEDIPDDSPLKESVDEILTDAKRAKELVKQILTFSHKTEQELKPLKQHLVIKEVIKLIKASIPTIIEIKQKIDSNCRTIIADSTQVHQIAMNLITNSYPAMQDSGGVVTIILKNVDLKDHTTHFRLDGGPHILLATEDTGVGTFGRLWNY